MVDINSMAYEAAMKFASKLANEELGLFEWALKFCPHFIFRQPSENFHKPLCRTFDTLKPGANMVIICPRGYAKSTWAQMKILKSLCEATEPYTLLIMDSTEQAEQSLKVVREELETNERIREAYAQNIYRGPVWNNKEIITSGGCCVQALGTGKKVRGRRYKQHRPSLVILDDPQNDEQVETPGQRGKDWRWLQKAVMKCGDRYTKFVIIGTVLHKDCLVCKAERQPNFTVIRYRALLKWPQRMDLWTEWAQLYTNGDVEEVNGAKTRSSVAADEFYDTYKEEMDKGAVLLWAEKESLEHLMKEWASDPVSFMSEKQNESFDPTNCEFDPAWVSEDREGIWYDDVAIFNRMEKVTVGYVDWSKGKETKRADYTSVIILHFDGKNAYVECDIQKLPVSIVCENIVGWDQQVNFVAFGTETTGFQSLAADDLKEAAERSNRLEFINNIILFDNQIKKTIRIARLSSWLQRGFFKFKRNCPYTMELIGQILEFPNPNAHDDGPDALEGALRTLNNVIYYDEDDGDPEEMIGSVA